MDLGDVGPRHLGHAMAAERRNDHALQHAPVALGRARFQPERDVLPVEAVGELLDRDGFPVGIAPGGRILTILGRGDDGDRPAARLLAGEHGAGPEADAARSSTGAVLHDISLAAARQHTQPEAGEFVVPDEMLSLFILCGIDDALGQFRHVLRSRSDAQSASRFDRARPWKHHGSKRANTAARTCENQRAGWVA